MHTELDLTRRARLRTVLMGAALLTLGGSGVTAYADTPAPQLSIAVDDGGDSVSSGDRLHYTVTVVNLGGRTVEDLRVSQTVPTGASFVSADFDGDQAKGEVGWSVDLKGAEKVTLHTSMAVASTPDSALRLATVACARVSVKSPALVCASDSDQLPAGAAAEQAQTQADAEAEADAVAPAGWFEGSSRWYVGGAAAVVLAAIGAALTTRRRHRSAARAEG